MHKSQQNAVTHSNLLRFKNVSVACIMWTTECTVVQNPVDHAGLSNEETRNIKKELDEIDKKFDEAR